MNASRPSETPVTLHLRIRQRNEDSAQLEEFLAEAAACYERLGDCRVRLLQNMDDRRSFIEVVEYDNHAAYLRGEERTESDPEMRGHLERWRALIDGRPEAEVYLDLTPRILAMREEDA